MTGIDALNIAGFVLGLSSHRETLPFPPVVISIDDYREMMTVAVDLDEMPAERRETSLGNRRGRVDGAIPI